MNGPLPDAEPEVIGELQSHQVHVFEVVRAPIRTAVWVQKLLGPALIAVKLESARPIEFRPTGRWGGWAGGDRARNPDDRISISSRAHMWSKTNFVDVYIHEIIHALLARESLNEKDEECPGLHEHDAAFFALNLLLLMRLDAAKYVAGDTVSDWANCVGFYDLQDPPSCWVDAPQHIWKPRAIAWSMGQAHELFSTDLSAEKCAKLIGKRYFQWADLMQAEPAQIAQSRTKLAKKSAIETEVNLKRKNDLFLFKSMFFMVTAAFLWVVYYTLAR